MGKTDGQNFDHRGNIVGKGLQGKLAIAIHVVIKFVKFKLLCYTVNTLVVITQLAS